MQVATATHARISRARPYDPAGFYDEALLPDGTPRPEYAHVFAALRDLEPSALQARIRAHPAARAATFTTRGQTRQFALDPIPRIVTAGEWRLLERGLAQRARALNAFIADVYGKRRIIEAGVVPARTVDRSEYFEPWMLDVPVPSGHATVAGFDVVRGADGHLRVLEDNLRAPSGLAYASAARRVMESELPVAARIPKLPVDSGFGMLANALRQVAPEGVDEPNIAVLSEGPANSAWYEHRTLARRLCLPIVSARDLRQRQRRLYTALPSGRLRQVDVLYRRSDEDRLRNARGMPTWLAEALLEPLRAGRLAVVNAPGSGVGDDKLVHAYVEEMVRFYLREEPLIESVRTYDLGDPQERARALERLPALVIKPRAGHGGHGIVIGPHASPGEREEIAGWIRADPENFVAQETVMLSRHPTVCDGRVEPRHVDLRVFAITFGDEALVIPGGLTRVALDRGSLVVNTSQNGGGKDTWVLA